GKHVDRDIRATQPLAWASAHPARRRNRDQERRAVPAVPQTDLPPPASPLHARHPDGASRSGGTGSVQSHGVTRGLSGPRCHGRFLAIISTFALDQDRAGLGPPVDFARSPHPINEREVPKFCQTLRLFIWWLRPVELLRKPLSVVRLDGFVGFQRCENF